MFVECPGCAGQVDVEEMAMAPSKGQGGQSLVQCPQCGLGGRVGQAGQAGQAHRTEPPRTVAYVCRCGYHTDLPEEFRYRLGRCPACDELVMAGEIGASTPLLLTALEQVRACQPSPALAAEPSPIRERRHAPRFPAIQLAAQFSGGGTRLPVTNLSVSGLAVLSMPRELQHPGPVLLTLQERERPVLTALSSRLVRVAGEETGLAFEGLTMAQRRVLHLLLVRTARRANAAGIIQPSRRLAGLFEAPGTAAAMVA